ncbi:pyridoxal-phosphate dependent enzyme [Janthinobacterium lividum]|uniref:pyridoxal-phosphate dependent enzyme n=1 Tax=Janthinobacterium lividum TaxID=29581 RepID=UPI000874CC8F|nr:pyridoxal-phosphate dependent enzyme [Janthinobacterium lividum]MCC7712024.1 pyridoxal-phosphate dependent enzyme [Janthinobacterium lividum]OEZ57081.1 phenylserine dehydratase [Janthinobacterium lividum]WQE27289.1 pyridoxal-phosphate dependent enzyme [Janthinobacterium lividum]STQ98185.1 Phenylserine dehydratase [Janthinobacterium lividum]
MALHIETPLLNSRALSLHSERAIWLKLEALQPPGSFKIRGIGLACEEYARRGASRFISSSGGNAGIAVAYAGRQLGIPVIVVVPETTSQRARALIAQEGAEVIVHGAAWQEANALAQSMLTPQDAFLHPFDDPLLWQGHAGMVDEVARAGLKPDAVVLSVGGGGLLAGVAEGLQRNGWDDVALVAVETQGAASLAAAVAAREHVTLPAVTSIATSLAARQVCAQAFAISQTRLLHSVVVSDQAAVDACQRFITDQRLVVEPACGAALAAVYGKAPELAPYRNVLVIVCGGVTATTQQLDHWTASL